MRNLFYTAMKSQKNFVTENLKQYKHLKILRKVRKINKEKIYIRFGLYDSKVKYRYQVSSPRIKNKYFEARDKWELH